MTTKADLIRMKEKGLLTHEEFTEAVKKLEIANGRAPAPTPVDPDRMRKRILFAVALLGIFSVLAGLGLIIAAKWAVIPPMVKIAGGLACLAVSLTTSFYFQQNKKPLWMEAFLFISFLLIGGNIGLIQQSYNLQDITLEKGSFIWWAVSLPLVFFTKKRIIPLCQIGLLCFAGWDILWNLDLIAVAAGLFVFMLLTHFFNGPQAKFLRELAFFAAIFCLYAGDLRSTSLSCAVGVILTTLFLILALPSKFAHTEDGTVRFYNYLFLLVAARIFLLFWTAYYNLEEIGILLIVFGTVLLGGAGLYTYYFKQIQKFIKGFVCHE